MTEAEKNEIVGLIMNQISSQAVDFDIETEQPQANDLLTAVRQTSSGAYVGVTLKWDDVARIATELANQAATRAEQAKTNVENMKSSVEQTVTDFNALAEEKKQEVQGVYQSDLNELKGDLVEYSEQRFGTNKLVWEDSKYIDLNGNVQNGSGRSISNFISCVQNMNIKYIAETNHSNILGISFYDKNYSFISGVANNGDINTEQTAIVPKNAVYLRLSINTNLTNHQKDFAYVIFNISLLDALSSEFIADNSVLYVSTNGNDKNDGSYEYPLATVNKALSLGAKTVFLFGGNYYQQIDLSKSKNGDVTIAPIQETERVVFLDPNCTIANSATKETGYTKVYSFDCSKPFANGNKWIFQDGVFDSSTIISTSERHPLQRGLYARCNDTRIEKCTSTTLQDALNEIENYSGYKWFYDGTKVYLSTPRTISSTNPIRASFENSLFINGGRRNRLTITGIECKYMMFDVSNTTNPTITDCACHNAYGAGGFLYNQVVGGTFTRCEASNIFKGGNGDGFNGHSVNSGSILGKQTTVTLIDCWAHDVNDDGYSDHERSETTIIGGLYEYCGKGAITPSYGSHCTCYNVYARKAPICFYYTGAPTSEEGGVGGQIACYGCVAEDNTYSQGGGYVVDGEGNSMILSDCKSINNRYAYKATDETNRITLINCKSVGNKTAEIGGNGTVTTKI